MKELMEFAGSLLYIIFSIITFPLMVVTQCLLEGWAAVKYMKTHKRQWTLAFRKKQKAFNPLPHYVTVAKSRIKSLHW